VPFKRYVYMRALQELAPLLFKDKRQQIPPPMRSPRRR